MAADSLVEVSDLDGFPGGADLTSGVVAAACGLIRDYCGWHIAPTVAETLVVEACGGQELVLPGTMYVAAVTAIRDTTGDVSASLTGFRAEATPRFRAGILTRFAGWPWGYLEVDVSHGYETCPPALLAAVVELSKSITRGDLASKSIGDKSESWRDQLSPTSQAALASYKIPRSP